MTDQQLRDRLLREIEETEELLEARRFEYEQLQDSRWEREDEMGSDAQWHGLGDFHNFKSIWIEPLERELEEHRRELDALENAGEEVQ